MAVHITAHVENYANLVFQSSLARTPVVIYLYTGKDSLYISMYVRMYILPKSVNWTEYCFGSYMRNIIAI